MSAKKKSSFWSDFKAFISRGNVVDMAVGVVIGGAFGKIVTGLVEFILNPICALFLNGVNLAGLKIPCGEITDAEGATVTNYIMIGAWIQTIIDFLIVALCIFLILRLIMKAREKMDAKKIAEEKAAAEKAAAEKAEADAAAAEAAAAAAARQAAVEDAILKQAELLEKLVNKQ